LFAAAFLAVPALAAELPALTGRVVDTAGLIDPATEAQLTAKLEAFERKSSDQIVVATIPSLGGEAIEPFANRLFRFWKLGQEGEDNGVLMLVARDDRKTRIEVGYGLEGTLTDLHAKLIIENTLLPRFRAGDFSGGIAAGVDDIVTVLEGNAAELEARLERNPPDGGPPGGITPEGLFVLLWFGFVATAIALSVLPPLFGEPLGDGRYRWLGMTWDTRSRGRRSGSGWSSGSSWSSGGSGWSSGGSSWSSGSSGGGFSGGGGSSGGGGASGSW
jgi:uncharacterized protein